MARMTKGVSATGGIHSECDLTHRPGAQSEPSSSKSISLFPYTNRTYLQGHASPDGDMSNLCMETRILWRESKKIRVRKSSKFRRFQCC